MSGPRPKVTDERIRRTHKPFIELESPSDTLNTPLARDLQVPGVRDEVRKLQEFALFAAPRFDNSFEV